MYAPLLPTPGDNTATPARNVLDFDEQIGGVWI